jgi:DNA-binding transcriptional regulator YiaG
VFVNFRDQERLAKVRRLIASGQAKELRIAGGLSLSEAGAPVPADASTVWRWENGKRMPRGDAALRYLRVLEMLEQIRAAS